MTDKYTIDDIRHDFQVFFMEHYENLKPVPLEEYNILVLKLMNQAYKEGMHDQIELNLDIADKIIRENNELKEDMKAYQIMRNTFSDVIVKENDNLKEENEKLKDELENLKIQILSKQQGNSGGGGVITTLENKICNIESRINKLEKAIYPINFA